MLTPWRRALESRVVADVRAGAHPLTVARRERLELSVVRAWCEAGGCVLPAEPSAERRTTDRQMTPRAVRDEAVQRMEDGATCSEVARRLGVPRVVVWQWLQRYGSRVDTATYIAVLHAGRVYPRAVRVGGFVHLRTYGRDHHQPVPWADIEAWAPREGFTRPARGTWTPGPASTASAGHVTDDVVLS